MKDTSSGRLTRFGGWCATASGIIAGIGIVFLIVMYIGFATNNPGLQGMGTVNDICVILQYVLAVPIALALHQRLKKYAPGLSRTAMWIGIAGILAVVILQFLLVTDVLAFEQQVGPVILALLVVGIWLIVTGHLGRSTGEFPSALGRSLLAMLYLGYPVWAVWMGRQLLSRNVQSVTQRNTIRGEMA